MRLLLIILLPFLLLAQPVHAIMTAEQACEISYDIGKKATGEWFMNGFPTRLSQETEDEVVNAIVNCLSYYDGYELQQRLESMKNSVENLPSFSKYIFSQVEDRILNN